MKRTLAFFTLLILLITLSTPCYAATNNGTVVSPLFNYINNNSIGLSIDESTGVASCTAHCYAPGYTVEVQCKLQRYTAITWLTVKEWTETGDGFARVSKNWAVYSGYTYRVYAIFNIYDTEGNLLETATNSKLVTYPQQ